MTEEEIEEEVAYLEEFPDVELTIEEIMSLTRKLQRPLKNPKLILI